MSADGGGTWQLVEYDTEFYAGRTPPATPPPEAETAQPSCWKSLYDGRRIVATWFLDRSAPPPPSGSDATIESS